MPCSTLWGAWGGTGGTESNSSIPVGHGVMVMSPGLLQVQLNAESTLVPASWAAPQHGVRGGDGDREGDGSGDGNVDRDRVGVAGRDGDEVGVGD